MTSRLILCGATLFLGFFATSLPAALPRAMITHNTTSLTENAYVDGIPAPSPAWPYSTSSVPWSIVNAGCSKYAAEGICPAVIKIGIYKDSPITIGTLYVDLAKGTITPSEISSNGFTVKVHAPGEIIVLKEKTDS